VLYKQLTFSSAFEHTIIFDFVFYHIILHWYMYVMCAMSTQIADCYNLKTSEDWCDMMASDGQCVRNYPYMYSHCRRACLKCDADITGKSYEYYCE